MLKLPGETEKELLVDASDDGEFRCEANNSLLPLLTLYSRHIHLTQSETIVVNSIGDAGLYPPDRTDTCTTGSTILRNGIPEIERTLRAAIQFINNKKSSTRINIFFDIPDVSTAVIQPNTVLPTILYPINLQGATQPGADFVVLEGGNLPQGGGLIIRSR